MEIDNSIANICLTWLKLGKGIVSNKYFSDMHSSWASEQEDIKTHPTDV